MELRVLRYFLAVAREENISAAADFLHVTQPTLSRQLMELEENLGTKLFIRGNRKITLTQEGMFLRKRAQEIVDLVDKTEADFHTPEEIISGNVYIGGGESDAIRLIGNVISRVQQEHPDIHYHLFSGNAEDVTERLDKGLLDFGILIDPPSLKEYDYLRLPFHDQWGVFMRQDSALTALEVIQPKDLWNVPLIISRQTLANNDLTGWLSKDLNQLQVIATYNLIFNAARLVEEGVGYALALDKLIPTCEDSQLCFRLLDPPVTTNILIVWKKYQIFSKPAEILLQYLQQVLASIS